MKNFTVYKSSAGSGKTFTLVKEYLRLALSDPSEPPALFKNILAITFTNKAAAEMKERVIHTLRKLSVKNNKEPMGEILCSELNFSPDALSDRSEKLLIAILHNYADFSIGTIDSFIHRIVRSFALDLRLPLNFGVETNRDRLLAQCIDELTARVGEDELVTSVLLEFSRARVEEDRSWNIDQELFSFSKKMLDESGSKHLAKLKDLGPHDFMQLKKWLQREISAYRDQLVAMAGEVMGWCEKKNLGKEDFYYSGSGIWNYFLKLTCGEFGNDIVNNNVRKTLYEGKWKSGGSALSDQHIDWLKKRLVQIEDFRSRGAEKYFTCKAIYRNIFSLIVINEIDKILERIKEEENIVFISEFNSRISEIVMNEPVPFIFERIGEKYRHFLVDEFQDTSVLQWQNLLPLIDNSLAAGNFNLLVGDGKQSIYRWRGGEVEQFASLPRVHGPKNDLLADREEALERNYDEKILGRNFRSAKKIVEFNNLLYQWMKEKILPEHYRGIYKDHEQLAGEKNDGGYVSFDLVPADISAEEKEEAVCGKTLEYIRKNVNEFGYRFSEITVLTRKNSEGKLIADYLLRNQVPVVSSESLLIAKNSSVRLVVAVLKLVAEPRNEVQEAFILMELEPHPVFAGSEFSAIWREFSASRKNLGDWLFSKGLADIRRHRLAGLPLYDVCAHVARELKLAENDPLFIQFFLDEVLKFSKTERENLKAFLEWWEDHGHSVSAVLPAGTNAVSIMTIHTAKGLEFPVVIMPFADWEIKKADALWIELKENEIPGLESALVSSGSHLKNTPYESYSESESGMQLLDNVNLLYVATTRPIAHLHIISRIRRNNYVDGWLREFFSSCIGPADAPGAFQFGAMMEHPGRRKEEILSGSFRMDLRDWKEIVRIKFHGEEYPEMQVQHSRREAGILFHQVMARINERGDVRSAASWAVQKGLCTAEQGESLAKKIAALFSDPQFSGFFGKGFFSRNEPEIISVNGKAFRPDRLVFFPDHVAVIDYKTGAENDQYEAQLNSYASALRELGHPLVKKYIVYVEEERIERLG